MSEYWNTALTVRVVVEACAAQGVDTAPILAAADIDQSVVDDPEGRVSLEQMRRFWEAVVAQSQDLAIGLHAAERVPYGFYGLIDYLLAYSPTIGDGLTRFGHYLPLVNNWATTRPEDHDEQIHLITEVVWGAVPRTTAEYIAAILVERSRTIWGMPWAPDLMRFEFGAPAPFELAGEHERVFGCPVEFGAARTEMVISRQAWDQSVRTADPGLVSLLEQQAAQIMARLPSATTLVQQVRAEIRDALAGGDQRIDGVAARLNTSARTLQRRLGQEGLSFATIVDEVRLEAAKLALADLGMSLAHVAYFVGFEEQSSFSRAFKRWTGTTPKEYRQSLTATVASDWPEQIEMPD